MRSGQTGRYIAVPMLSVWLLAGYNVADEFPTPRNSDTDENAAPMSPEAAAASFDVPHGFQVSVFAAEPDVQNPIAMTWDSRGRMWIAENFTYAERAKRFDLSFRDRVILLEDSTGDGHADKRIVFTDQVQMLTSIEVGHGGIWLMCPPRLLFIPDRNLDDVPDGPAQVMLDGFTVAKDNYHNFANGLKWGPDGWLYGRCGGSCPGRIGLPGSPQEERLALEGGIWRFHPRTKAVEVLTHGTTNPWGHDWNSMGEMFFINTVNGHLWHLIPGAHLMRPFTLDPNTKTYELIDMHADHWHFDTGAGWTKSRDGVANEYGGGHAHTGMMIYLGDNWPEEYRDHLFTFNIHGQRANQEILERHGSGYIGRHGNDMLSAADPFFRGNDLTYGPDGSVYIIDWSDTGECHEHTGVHRTSGRVYRVAYEQLSKKRQSFDDLRTLSNDQLIMLHDSKNDWHVRQARLILSERAANGDNLQEAESRLQELTSHTSPQVACRALLTLHTMDRTDNELLRRQLAHSNEHLRVWAIRMLTDGWPLDDVFGPTQLSQNRSSMVTEEANALMNRFCEMAASDDSGLVRLALASTLQRLPIPMRAPLAMQLVSRSTDSEDHNLPLLVWYGLIPLSEPHPKQLAVFAINCRWPKTQRLAVRRLAENIDQNLQSVNLILRRVCSTDDTAEQLNILHGIEDGLRGWRKAPAPANWESVVELVDGKQDPSLRAITRNLSVIFGDGRAIDEVRTIVLDKSAPVGLRRSALESMIASQSERLRETCIGVLDDARLNVVAAKGLATFDDSEVGKRLVKNYRRFRSPERPRVISMLVTRKSFAHHLVDAIEEARIPVEDLTAFDVRQIRSLGDKDLFDRVSVVWGHVRDSTAEKHARINGLREKLTPEVLSHANLSNGRQLFNKTCSKCHRMFGVGENIGPDLTGSNRNNIDYLLENILDPSAVVNKDYRMSIIETEDGQVLNGLIVSTTDKSMALQTQTDLLTLAQDDIANVTTTSTSPMPDGLLDNLSDQQVRDLFAYLMSPGQVE